MHQLPKDITGSGKTEVQLVIDAPLHHVWNLFTAIERWREYTDIYEFGRWLSADKWTVGSSFEARMLWPFPLTMRYVVMSVRPHQEVRWLVHAIGIVIERWTRFQAIGDQTEITSSAIFFGTSTQTIPGEISDLLPKYTVRFYEDFKAACEREADISHTA